MRLADWFPGGSGYRVWRSGGQAAGPAASVTVAVCDWPLGSVQLMLILSPGWWLASTCWISVPELTDWPATEVITSPWDSPAAAAGVPLRTPAIATPEEPEEPKLSCWPVGAISTPRKAVVPMWTVAEAWPLSIWLAMDSAVLIGIANAWVVVCWPEFDDPLSPNPPNGSLEPPEPDEAAVSTPITWPCEFTSGPPESPAWMSAFVSIKPDSRSDELEPSSDAVIDWLSAVTAPAATDGVPPTPPALPMPTTLSPTRTVDESPVVAVVSPEAPDSCSTAMSWLAS